MDFFVWIRSFYRQVELGNTITYLFASLFQAVIGIVTLPIYTNYLTPDEFGIWALIIAINSFSLPLFQLGLNSYFIREYYSNGENNRVLFSTLFYFTLLWSFLLISLGLALGPLIFDASGISVSFYPFMAIILTSNIAVACFTYVPLKFRIEKRAMAFSTLLIIKSILVTGISLILVVVYDKSLLGRINGFLIGNLIFMIISIAVAFKSLTWAFDTKLVINGIKKCYPLIFATLSTLLFDTIDRLVLERYQTLNQLGFYSIGIQYAAVLGMTFTAFYKALEPKIFELSGKAQVEKIDKLFQTIALVLGLGGLLAIFLSRPILQLLVQKSYFESIPIARTLILATFTQSIYLLFSTYFVSLYSTRFVMTVSIAGLIAFVISSFYVTSVFGAVGLAVTKSLSFVFMLLLLFMFGRKHKYFYKSIGIFTLIYFALLLTLIQ